MLEMDHGLLKGDDKLSILLKPLKLVSILCIIELSWVSLNFEPFIIDSLLLGLECLCSNMPCKTDRWLAILTDCELFLFNSANRSD